jgi:hypothetical protein
MRIEWSPPLRPATQRRDEKATLGDRSFTASVSGEGNAAASTKGASTMPAVEGLLSLQEIVADAQGGRKRALARGDKLLAALDGLRHALLAGALPRAELEALARLSAETTPLVDDARLREILSEIEIRAAVELAKLENLA